MKNKLTLFFYPFEVLLLLAFAVALTQQIYAVAASFIIAGAYLYFILISERNDKIKNLYSYLLFLFPAFFAPFFIFSDIKKVKKVKGIKVRKVKGKESENYIKNAFSVEYLSADNLTFYGSGKSYYAALIKSLKSAKRYIFFQAYQVKESKLFFTLLDILKEKVSSGVKVYFLCDGLGSFFFEDKLKLYLKAYGIKLKVYNPFGFDLKKSINDRHHGKMCVIDGKIAFLGSANVGDEYLKCNTRKDTGVSFSGETVISCIENFAKDFGISDFSDFLPERKTENKKNSVKALFFESKYTDKNSLLSGFLLTAISSAKESVLISTPYLSLDDGILNSILSAKVRGVNVTVIIPAVPDKKFVYEITKFYAIKLQKSGVKVVKYNGFIHAKNTVIDKRWVLTGSNNLDFRSVYYNKETSLYFESETLSDRITKNLLKNTSSFTAKQDKKSLAKMKLLSLFTPLV